MPHYAEEHRNKFAKRDFQKRWWEDRGSRKMRLKNTKFEEGSKAYIIAIPKFWKGLCYWIIDFGNNGLNKNQSPSAYLRVPSYTI